MICFRILFGKAWSTHVKESKLLYIPGLQKNDTFIVTKVDISQSRILIVPLSPAILCCKRQIQAPQCRTCFSLRLTTCLCQACLLLSHHPNPSAVAECHGLLDTQHGFMCLCMCWQYLSSEPLFTLSILPLCSNCSCTALPLYFYTLILQHSLY